MAEGIGVGYWENPWWAKNPPHWFGGDFEKPLELYCSSREKIYPGTWFLIFPQTLN